MHDSHLPLRKWFAAIHLLCESTKGVSAFQLHRTLDIARRTAWHLGHHICADMRNESTEESRPRSTSGNGGGTQGRSRSCRGTYSG